MKIRASRASKHAPAWQSWLQRGLLEGFGDLRILLLGNHVLACICWRGLLLANLFASNGSLMTNPSNAPKIGSYFILLRSAHLGGCLWGEREGLPHCGVLDYTLNDNRGIEKSSLWKRARSFKGKHTHSLFFFSHLYSPILTSCFL